MTPNQTFRHGALWIALLGMLSFPRCQETASEAEPMTRQLNALAEALETAGDCQSRGEILKRWTAENAPQMAGWKREFQTSCASGIVSRCMSLQLLASARVEVALKGCGESDLGETLATMNQKLGTAIRTP